MTHKQPKIIQINSPLLIFALRNRNSNYRFYDRIYLHILINPATVIKILSLRHFFAIHVICLENMTLSIMTILMATSTRYVDSISFPDGYLNYNFHAHMPKKLSKNFRCIIVLILLCYLPNNMLHGKCRILKSIKSNLNFCGGQMQKFSKHHKNTEKFFKGNHEKPLHENN